MSVTAIAAMAPLSSLYIHALNVRAEPPAQEIRQLADSIRDKGLIQNLSGWEDPARAGEIGIVAGGRRLRALQMIAAEDGEDFSVPVKVAVDEAEARDWAGTENTARMGLHPADEIRAYGNLRKAGRSNVDIARAFAVSETHVARRVALSNLPAEALDALRHNRITLDVAKVLTVVQDADRQRELTSWAVREKADARDMQNAVAKGKIRESDRRVKFVTLARYEAAGGMAEKDLFTSNVYLHDEQLLDELFEERLAEEARTFWDRGHAWLKTTKETSAYDVKIPPGFDRVEPPEIELPEADQAEIKAIHDIYPYKRTAEEEARLKELEARMVGEFEPEQYRNLGLVFLVNYNGELRTIHFLRDTAYTAPDDTVETVTEKPKADKIPESLKTDLDAIRLLSLQKRLIDQPELMLDLLAFHLTAVAHAWDAPLGVSINNPQIVPQKLEGTAIPQRLNDDEKGGKVSASPATFADFQAQGKKHRNAALAETLARAFWGRAGIGAALAHQLKANVRDVWIPTAAGYLSRINVDRLDAIFNELVPEDSNVDRADWLAQKKTAKAKWLEGLFSDMTLREAAGLSREQNAAIDAWLPAELTWPVAGDAA